MPRGGARAGAGRPPDEQSLAAMGREESWGEWTELPLTGRTGRVPAWPLPTPATAAERKLWNLHWKKPQAIMWEKLGQQLPVALYIRRYVEASEPGASASLTNSVMRLQDSLGISPIAMRSLRWRIVDRDSAKAKAPAAKKTAKKTTRASSKNRLLNAVPDVER